MPLLRGLSLLFTGEAFSDYQRTRAGIRDAGLIMGAMVPELDGAIQPTLIEGRDSVWYGRRYESFQEERIGLLVEHAKRWVRLRKAPNSDKPVAVVYVSGIGKGRIAAAGLNMPRSLMRFLSAMQADGYAFDNLPEDEDTLLDKGRNVSFERRRDLKGLAGQPGVLRLPADRYRRCWRRPGPTGGSSARRGGWRAGRACARATASRRARRKAAGAAKATRACGASSRRSRARHRGPRARSSDRASGRWRCGAARAGRWRRRAIASRASRSPCCGTAAPARIPRRIARRTRRAGTWRAGCAGSRRRS